ncbi:hypothetical protein U1Q18_024809 [Sarracenia purpurea var. burkii]
MPFSSSSCSVSVAGVALVVPWSDSCRFSSLVWFVPWSGSCRFHLCCCRFSTLVGCCWFASGAGVSSLLLVWVASLWYVPCFALVRAWTIFASSSSMVALFFSFCAWF